MAPSDLTNGERSLIMRALRYYISSERAAIQAAWLATRTSESTKQKRDAHYHDVKQQAESHIAAAEALLSKLMPKSTLHD